MQAGAQALAAKGDLLRNLGRFRDAIPAYEAFLRLTENGDLTVAGMPRAKGLMENHLGAALHGADRHRDAITAQERAIPLLREAGDRADEGHAQVGLAKALAGAGRIDEAITAYRTAAIIFGEVADRHGEGAAMYELGPPRRRHPE